MAFQEGSIKHFYNLVGVIDFFETFRMTVVNRLSRCVWEQPPIARSFESTAAISAKQTHLARIDFTGTGNAGRTFP